jgi:hypothetical protein
MMDAPDKGIPFDLFNKAECIIIIPGVKKAAFNIRREIRPRTRLVSTRRFGAPAAIRTTAVTVCRSAVPPPTFLCSL